MSTEQRRSVIDFFKVVMFISLSISGFLIANQFREQAKKFDEQHDDIKSLRTEMKNIGDRTIRIEYELKLRPN